jgi:hypothetical protein
VIHSNGQEQEGAALDGGSGVRGRWTEPAAATTQSTSEPATLCFFFFFLFLLGGDELVWAGYADGLDGEI